jgi:uncharacterized protein YndB with AHSA1/START domain
MIDVKNFTPAIVYVIYIGSTPEKVWEALTSAGFSRQYFSGLAVELEHRVGGAFAVRLLDGSVHINGEVIEYDPPRRLTVTWNVNWPGLVEKLGPTLVTYEIESVFHLTCSISGVSEVVGAFIWLEGVEKACDAVPETFD